MTYGICDIRFIFAFPGKESLSIVNVLFRTLCNTGHHFQRFHRKSAGSSLSRKHNGTGSVVYRIGYVCCLRTGRSWILNHGIQHLGSRNCQFPCFVYFLDNDFLGDWNLFIRKFHTHVSSGNHNCIGNIYNLIDILKTFAILDFGNNFNIFSAILYKQFSNLFHIIPASHKRRGYKINIIFYSKQNICFIAGAHKRHVYMDSRNIYSFVIGNNSRIHDHTMYIAFFYGCNFKFNKSVINKNCRSCLHILPKLIKCNAYNGVIAQNMSACQSKLLPFTKHDLSAFKIPESYFRSFGIQKNCYRFIKLTGRLTDCINTPFLVFMRSMGKIKSGNIHAFIYKLLQYLGTVCGRSESADNFCFAHYYFLSKPFNTSSFMNGFIINLEAPNFNA